MSKNSTKKPYKSVLASSPEELVDRMKKHTDEFKTVIEFVSNSDFLAFTMQSRPVDEALLSKAGIKKLVQAAVQAAKEDPERTALMAAKAILWAEKTVMTGRRRRPVRSVMPEPMTMDEGLAQAKAMMDSFSADDDLEVEERVASHLRSLGLDIVADPQAGPGRLRLVDDEDPLMVAINRAFIDEEYDDERQIVDAYLLDIRGVLKGGDRLQALQMISVMAQSHIPSAVKAAKSLQEAL